MSGFVVREMTAAEFEAYRRASVEAYAEDHVRAGDWAAKNALELAERETDALLPAGVKTPGMVLLVGEHAGAVVGSVWVGPAPRGRPGWWLYDLEVVPEMRGRGYGRELLGAADQAVIDRGGDALGLNVFGDNDVGRRLYESAGYRVTSAQMRKPLARASRSEQQEG